MPFGCHSFDDYLGRPPIKDRPGAGDEIRFHFRRCDGPRRPDHYRAGHFVMESPACAKHLASRRGELRAASGELATRIGIVLGYSGHALAEDQYLAPGDVLRAGGDGAEPAISTAREDGGDVDGHCKPAGWCGSRWEG